jgi:hypothetical protein
MGVFLHQYPARWAAAQAKGCRGSDVVPVSECTERGYSRATEGETFTIGLVLRIKSRALPMFEGVQERISRAQAVLLRQIWQGVAA